ncbi:MAG: oligosaccharide flippase family protein [Candidatus Marinimicrobia bacterium]|nr:oligosaccharide flippase family protein [Candidatus Neomarinimicrobiota bacterium]
MDKNFTFELVARFVVLGTTTLVSFILIPLLSKNLGAQGYGVWTQISITSSLIAPFITLKTEIATIRFANRYDHARMNWIYIILSLGVILNCLLLIGISLLFLDDICGFLFGLESKTNSLGMFILFWGFIISTVTSRFWEHILRAKDKNLHLSLLQTIRALLLLLCSLCYITIKNTFMLEVFLTISIILNVIVIIIILTTELTKGIYKLSWNDSLQEIFKLVKYSFPLVPYAFLVWVSDVSDRYIINYYLGLSSVGSYGLNYNICKYLSLAIGPITFVVFPSVSKLWDQGDYSRVRYYLDVSLKLFTIMTLPFLMIFFVFYDELITLLAKQEFVVSLWTVAFLMLGTYVFNLSQIIRIGPHLIEKTKILSYGAVISAFLNLVLNFALVPQFGLGGAAFSTLICYSLFTIVILYINIKNNLFFIIDVEFYTKFFFICFVFFFISKFIDLHLELGLFLKLGLAFGVFILTCYVFRLLPKDTIKAVRAIYRGRG